jgi:hypothetical protein
MKTLEITHEVKAIDILAKEWRDRVNGNSYFSARIELDMASGQTKIINIPFQYGYENAYIDECKAALADHKYISPEFFEGLRKYCIKNNIELIARKRENCLKKDVIAFGKVE